MNRRKVGILVVASMVVVGLAVWGCAQKASGPQTVKLAVTDRGFVPAEIQVDRGQPVTLLVTRQVEATCANEIVIADAGIREKLPLNQEVRITFTPETKGELRYACPMDMIMGSIRVQ